MNALAAWRQIPPLVRQALADADGQLDRVAPDADMSLRELVHHITEANLVAASIIVAASGRPGSTYDWSWMQPFGPWMDRMDYRHKPIEPALALLDVLNAYVAAQIEALPDGLTRDILLQDAPDAVPRRATVEDVLRQEADHARQHLASPPPGARSPTTGART